jgi:hypothetical protein
MGNGGLRALITVDGAQVGRGTDIVRLGSDGRIAEVVGFRDGVGA